MRCLVIILESLNNSEEKNTAPHVFIAVSFILYLQTSRCYTGPIPGTIIKFIYFIAPTVLNVDGVLQDNLKKKIKKPVVFNLVLRP